jgi:hypothetical protein
MSNIDNCNYQQKLRRAVISFLGSKCCKCGFEDIRALQIDHVNGRGNIHRKNNSWSTIYRSIINRTNTEKFQLLCANCNYIKRFVENNYCVNKDIKIYKSNIRKNKYCSYSDFIERLHN